MKQNIQNVLDSILTAFQSGDIPEAVAIASFPIPDIPSANWSFMNRTIQFVNGTMDARGYKQWSAVDRHVKKGSKAIYILVPCFHKVVNGETGKEESILRYFKASAVFKKEATEGAELEYENIQLPDLPLLQRAQDWGINVKAIPGDYRFLGYFNPQRKVIALATPSEKTFFHELAHCADYIIKGSLKPGAQSLQEITAELSAQVLARMVGKSIEDTTGNSYRYIKHYAEQIKMSPYSACLKVLSDVHKVLNLVLYGEPNTNACDLQKVA